MTLHNFAAGMTVHAYELPKESGVKAAGSFQYFQYLRQLSILGPGEQEVLRGTDKYRTECSPCHIYLNYDGVQNQSLRCGFLCSQYIDPLSRKTFPRSVLMWRRLSPSRGATWYIEVSTYICISMRAGYRFHVELYRAQDV